MGKGGGEKARNLQAVCDVSAAHGNRAAVGVEVDTVGPGSHQKKKGEIILRTNVGNLTNNQFFGIFLSTAMIIHFLTIFGFFSLITVRHRVTGTSISETNMKVRIFLFYPGRQASEFLQYDSESAEEEPGK